jgi:chymotrypsin
MKLFVAIVCALWALANANVPFEEVRHIDELLLQSPDKYPFIAAMYQVYGKSRGGRIVGGQVATRGQFPYQCAMYITATSGGTFFCGCSIISSRTILTAAHCVDQARSVQVILGAQNINQNEPEQVRYTVSSSAVRVHENWNSQQIANDIALITLPSAITFNQYIQKVNLPRWSDQGKDYLNQDCTTSGWGKPSDASSGTSSALRYVHTSVMSNAACRNVFGNFVRDNNICATGSGGKGSCNGDSGGPNVLNDNGIKQVGIVSFGAAAGCEKGFPHVYARVTSFLDWIEKYSDVVIQA